ncbi:MAG: NADH-quinone oxidoreductase subunit L [Cytophagales bacterium]|nr:MAG: NADH-quinone oxidoreductase subunit L [Cytophagales bacterium]
MMIELVWLIPILPLLGFLVLGIGNNKISKSIAGIIACGSILGAFLIVLSLLIPMLNGTLQATTISYFEWISTGKISLSFSFLVDPLSIVMMTIITGVGFLIHLYSAGYMSHDEGMTRYFAFLNLFVFSMLLLVMGANYLVLFAGWEGVGFCSYMLIGFWYKNQNYNDAAKKAFIMNRIGDLGFLLGMLLILQTFGSLEYSAIFSNTSNIVPNSNLIIAITFLLFIGAMGKSAQIPLYTWLPDAMAGPTPVSALIHAATMVTAGIYVIVRSNVLYNLAPATLEIIQFVGIATALFAATIGLVQNDIKKVLAYSTVSQLGYMFFAIGLGAYSTALFHVVTHAFFKALLFLGAGSVIHAMSGEQDIRNMGGLSKKLPITFITFLLATLAISGIPPFAGFFSKDEILAHAFEKSPLLWGLGLVGALMTTFYMFRLFFLTFFGTFRGTEDQKHHLHESPLSMTIPLAVLALLSTIGGFIGIPEVLGGNNWFKHFLTPIISSTHSESHLLSHSTEWILMGLSVGAVLLTIIITYIVYVSKKSIPSPDHSSEGVVHKLLSNKYYIDEIYESIFVKPMYQLSQLLHQFFDLKIIDGIVNGFGLTVNKTSARLKSIQDGSLGFYLFAMVGGIILILIFNTIL